MDELFEPVSTRRTFEAAIDQLADRVRSGDLPTGARLPAERDLAARMRISRPTLREAVRVLVQARVFTVRRGPNGGIFVRSELVPRDLVRSKSELRIGEVAGVLEARRVLEPKVAQLAALRASEEDFRAMQVTIDRQRELVSQPDFLSRE